MEMGRVTQPYLEPPRTCWDDVPLSSAEAGTVFTGVWLIRGSLEWGHSLTAQVELAAGGGAGFEGAAVGITYQYPVRAGALGT